MKKDWWNTQEVVKLVTDLVGPDYKVEVNMEPYEEWRKDFLTTSLTPGLFVYSHEGD